MKENPEHIAYVPREHPSILEEREQEYRARVRANIERDELFRARERARRRFEVPPSYGFVIDDVMIKYGIDSDTYLVFDDSGHGNRLSDFRWSAERANLLEKWIDYNRNKKRRVGIFENEDFLI